MYMYVEEMGMRRDVVVRRGQGGLPARVFRWPSASISSMTLMISWIAVGMYAGLRRLRVKSGAEGSSNPSQRGFSSNWAMTGWTVYCFSPTTAVGVMKGNYGIIR